MEEDDFRQSGEEREEEKFFTIIQQIKLYIPTKCNFNFKPNEKIGKKDAKEVERDVN